MSWQYVVVGVIVFVAIAYAVYVIWEGLSQRNNPCRGCKGCSLQQQMKRQRHRHPFIHCPKPKGK